MEIKREREIVKISEFHFMGLLVSAMSIGASVGFVLGMLLGALG